MRWPTAYRELLEAIRSINKWHNLDAAYQEVCTLVKERDPEWVGDDKDHPSVVEYDKALTVIRRHLNKP